MKGGSQDMTNGTCIKKLLWGATIWKMVVLALLLCTTGSATATTIVENLGGPTMSFGQWYWGESFVTPAGLTWNNLTFNFFSDVPASTPIAAGTAFLLSQQYLGTPAALNTSTPGFMAASTGISGGMWQFDASVTILHSMTYWIYENALIQISGNNAVPGANIYFTNSPNSNFISGGSSNITNFRLSGTAGSTVPEPTSLLLLGTGLGVVGFSAWRRKK
jgi:hypothetical protein